MEKNFSEKVLYGITIFLTMATLLLSLIFPTKNSLYLFLLVFGVIYWQRKRFQNLFQRIKKTKITNAIYILTGWLWAIFLEFALGLSPFHPNPIANYLIGIGFYLPYFAIWLICIKRYQFTSLEVFYLSGFGRLIFDFLITRRILTSAIVTTSSLAAFLVVIIQALSTLVLFGALTTLPTLYLKSPENKDHSKPLKQYLISLTPNFLASGVFIVWTIILKLVFT